MFKWFKYLTALPSLISIVGEVLGLVRNAEDLVAGGDKGAQKKALALSILGTAVDLGQHLGIPEADKVDKGKLLDTAGTVIDALVGVLNAAGVFKHAPPPAP